MNATKLLVNKRAELNAYQLACGYVQAKVNKTKHIKVSLWHESGHYHVRATYCDHPEMVGWLEWSNAIELLQEARAEYRRMVKQYL